MTSSENPVQKGPDFTVSEADLAATSGINRKMLMHLRQTRLVAGLDWVKERKEIKLTAAAAINLTDAYALLLPGSLKSVADEKTPPPADPPIKVAACNGSERTAPSKIELTELTVKGAQPSFKQLRALDPDGQHCLVRVQNTANFLPGSKLFARRVAAGLYEFTGPLPRWRGDKLYRS